MCESLSLSLCIVINYCEQFEKIFNINFLFCIFTREVKRQISPAYISFCLHIKDSNISCINIQEVHLEILYVFLFCNAISDVITLCKIILRHSYTLNLNAESTVWIICGIQCFKEHSTTKQYIGILPIFTYTFILLFVDIRASILISNITY